MIEFDVEYYDDEHKKKLSGHDYSPAIGSLVKNGIKVTEDEFVVYSLFREQKNYPGWRNYQELKQKLPTRIDTFRDYFDTGGGTLKSKFPRRDFDIKQTESAGVATALLAMNEIFNLHEADWGRIPTTKKFKTLDFELASELASNGKRFIQVEAKGTIFESKSLDNTAALKKKIEEKKEAQGKLANANTLFFGVIAGFPYSQNSNAVGLLLDPPLNNNLGDPQKHRLLARLYYYVNNLRTISKSHLVMALMNRIRVLELADDYTEFDRIPLVDVYGETLETPPTSIYSKTMIDEEIAGNVFPISRREFFYSAFDLEVYNVLVKQDFEMIRNYESKLARIVQQQRTIKARVEVDDLKRYDLSPSLYRQIPHTKQVIMELTGKIFATRSGRVVGFLNQQ